MPELSVQIKADLTNYIAGLKQAGSISASAASDITKQLGKVAAATDAAGGSALSASMRFQTMRSGMSAARDGMIGLTMSGQRADSALMAMGHHFTSLIGETGSLSGAFKALGNSLMGAGGVILIVTLAAELWHKYSQSQKEAEQATADYVTTIESVRAAQLKGEQTGQAEITRLKILYDATQDHTLSLQARNKAYDELETKYPQFFTNADREKTLLGENSLAYNQLARSILAAAYAKAYEAQIGVNVARDLENQQKVIDLQKQQQDNLNNASSLDKRGVSGRQTGSGTTNAQIANIAIQQKINDLQTDSNKLNDQNRKLTELASGEELAAGYQTESQITKKNAALKEQNTGYDLLKQQITDLETTLHDAITNGASSAVIDATAVKLDLLKDKLAVIDLAFKNSQLAGKGAGPLSAITGDVGVTTKGKSDFTGDIGDSQISETPLTNMDQAVSDYKKLTAIKLAAHAASVQYKQDTLDENKDLKMLESTLGTGLVNAMQQSLAGGENFFAAIGKMLLQLIEKLIETAIAAEALSLILQFTGLGEILGITGAAGSFSSIFKGMSGISVPGHAAGGITLKPHLAMVGEGGENEVIAPLSQLKNYMGNSGGNDGMVMGESRLQGATLVTQILRANKQKLRTG